MTKQFARRVLPALAIAAVLPATASAQQRVQRFALVIGANQGGAERARLQYAVTDAERFAQVLVELGGVSPADASVLRQPRLQDMIEALDRMTARVAERRRAPGGGRTEVLLYYSGHADEQGLLLGEDRYSYRTLRDRLDQIPADVRIAVLDACASGAFTRMKSGRKRPAFLVDEAANMRGHAFLTSSAATEVAQESDRIRASYFTHYLVSGFRGAADLSGDGRITLNEAYQFAFNETLGRTVDTKGGAQHPSYDISLSGTGDVVMTDIRQTSATLVLGEDLDGRFFVRNARKELVVELYKPRGRRVELGVEPGPYEVRMEIQKRSLAAKADVPDGGRLVLEAAQFGAVTVEHTHRRGGPEAPRLAVDGRNRLALRFGMWRTASEGTVSTGIGAMDTFGALEYQRYLREDLSIAISVQGLGGVAGTATGPEGVFAGVADVIAMPITARWYPLAKGRENQAVKPFVATSLGPVFGSSSGSFVGAGTQFAGIHGQTTIGGHVGGGVDFHLARSFALGVNLGYNWMVPFERPVGPRSSYDGVELGLTIACLFGKGRNH
jgi:hypothetical protein